MKKNTKRLLLSGLSLSLLLVLTGCVGRDSDGNPTGLIWNTIGQPMANLIKFFAENQGLGYGLAIVFVTIIVRFIILPFGLSQSVKAGEQAEKMAYLKPYLEPINERLRNATSQEEKMAAQTELMAAQRQMGINPLGGIGCLPLLIQMPFFSAMYFAAMNVPNETFLGFIQLGKRNLYLTAIIAALYFFQSWLSAQAMPEEQRDQAKSMMYSMPLMMVFFGLSMPASVSLYWLVGGFFSIFQQLLTTHVIRPRLAKKVAEEFEKNPPKAYRSPSGRKDVTATSSTSQTAISTGKTKRNAGKQKSRK